MGAQAFQNHPVVRDTFEEADDVLQTKISDICFSGPGETLTDTYNAQPAILATSVAYLRLYHEINGAIEPSYVAGHSMGEHTALVASGAISFKDGLRLVRERGRLMKRSGERNPGSMAAIIRMDTKPLEEICRQASGPEPLDSVQIANYNAPGQLVISGNHEAVERAMALAREEGARVIPLAVSVGSHSPLMEEASQDLGKVLNTTELAQTRVPIVTNVSARPITAVEQIKAALMSQLVSPVRWISSIEFMRNQGVDTFVEIGPRNVVSGLVRRIAPEAQTHNVEEKLGYAPKRKRR
jgi:[acyl-carrier-protein] S-malonyltransferase